MYKQGLITEQCGLCLGHTGDCKFFLTTDTNVKGFPAGFQRLEDEVNPIRETWDKTIKGNVVNHLPHYKAGGLAVIDIIEAFNLNFRLGNAVKYILRHNRKVNALQDLEKAAWYLAREIENMKKREG
jgi:hypothetical protein